MSFEADLKGHLQGSSALTALTADRISPTLREEGTAVPAVTYDVISVDPHNNLAGRDSSLRNYRVQIDCWARTHADALAMFDAIRARMGVSAATFSSVVLATMIEDFEPDTKLYRRSQDFSCWYRAT